ncbi:Penicillin-binding protein activator LpoB [Sodalis praecaptivus]
MQTGKTTAALTRLIAQGGGKFQVVGADKLNAARQTLGLSADDSLESRSKAVGLARYLNAQYVLYERRQRRCKSTHARSATDAGANRRDHLVR